jgi:hypothetical protein
VITRNATQRTLRCVAATRGFLFGISVGLLTLLGGSLPGLVQPVEAKHVAHRATLYPTGAWWQYRETTYSAPSCGLQPTVDDPTNYAGLLPVGFSYHATNDSCGTSDVYQLRVMFDMSEFRRYARVQGDPVYARLTYQEDFADTTNPPPLGSQGVTCINRLRIAADNVVEGGQFAVQDGDLFRAGLLNSDPWSLDDVVQSWIDGSAPNFGLILQGFDESADLRTAACVSVLSNFTLDVTEVWDQPAPQLRVQNLNVTDKNGSHVCATGTINVATTIHNESDVGAATYDVLLKVDGQPRETVIAGPIGAYSDRPETFLTTIDLKAGDHTLQVLVDPEHNVTRIEDPLDVASLSVNCAQGAAPTPAPKPAGLQVAAVDVQDADGHARCVAGNNNNIHLVVKNTGDSDVNAVIPVQLSVDGKPVRTTTIGGLAANERKDSFFTGATLSAGNHTVKVTVDPEHKLGLPVASGGSATTQVTCTKS